MACFPPNKHNILKEVRYTHEVLMGKRKKKREKMNEKTSSSVLAGERTTLLRMGLTQSTNRMLALVILRKDYREKGGIEGGSFR